MVRKHKKTRKTAVFCTILLFICSMLAGCQPYPENPVQKYVPAQQEEVHEKDHGYADLGDIQADEEKSGGGRSGIQKPSVQDKEPGQESGIPAYSGKAYVLLNGGTPEFPETDKTRTDPFEEYSPLDELGRCRTAYANICTELMPDEAREGISEVKPSGWNNRPYEFVDGGYLYNRCHLIGFQLAGENANEKNLITGTRYLNIEGMLPFENMVADYVKETGNHVLYRVTPVYEGDNMVASGVRMEGYSVEDHGAGILFNVYCYNIQPGVDINYADGSNHESGDMPESAEEPEEKAEEGRYIVNTNTGKFHYPDCPYAKDISHGNRMEYSGDRKMLVDDGYAPCGRCRP